MLTGDLPLKQVVFKSLIVLHTMIRNGGIDNVLSHLASDQGSLKLKNVVQGGNWQGEQTFIAFTGPEGGDSLPRFGAWPGQDAPRTMSNYAAYIDERIRAYRDLRHDVIRSGDSARTRGGADATTHRLRRLTVEKGLLREVAISQRVCSRLLDCAVRRYYCGYSLPLLFPVVADEPDAFHSSSSTTSTTT